MKPSRPLIPWILLTGLLGVSAAAVHWLILAPAEERLAQAEVDWVTARQRVAHHQAAVQARKDLARVRAALPTPRDFARLPLAISEVAKGDGVVIPTLSYTLEKTEDSRISKATLQGAVTGRYEDLRRFIHHLEGADRFLFIEDLSVGRSSGRKEIKGEAVTFHVSIGTYVRADQDQALPAPTRAP